MRKNVRNLLLQSLAAALLAGSALSVVNATGDEANASIKPSSSGTPASPTGFRGVWPVLKTGSSGTDVKTVQHLLAARGHAVNADGAYGKKTAAVVAKFQKRTGLKDDRAVGPKTWSKLTAFTLRTGAKGPAVKALQVQLDLKADGIYGKKTAAAVRTLQTKRNLPGTGTVDARTWNAVITGSSAKPVIKGYSLQFQKNWKYPTYSKLSLVRDGKTLKSWRAGSGKNKDECASELGWLPSGSYRVQAHFTNRDGAAIDGYAMQLPDTPCRPKAGEEQKPVNRTHLFIHSEMTRYGGQGKDTPNRDDSDRWENANDYKSLGCIKLKPTDIKDLFNRLDQARWPKNLTLHVS
ncbi:peptidoglycan-binding protein [Streptomyces sp. NPDC012486]|uniref:L,D-transpeptidase family protein n=1 Tax=Streptomyces TaxID=1883 RepID=UPI0029ABA814|nr:MULTISPECIES: peptidoglycan-binding protein [unclassified Streptomyces]MDX3186452.1 peptidoglycan-binding protein [Streptomyces sp. ME02-7008A-1]MDX3307143.1 peptidoglycan-binding protein [Streptomyces sp. ME02-7008A]